LKNARKNANSKEAIQKRIKTNIKRGYFMPDDILAEGLTFKQYKRKIYSMTKKIKSELFKIWDGHDYYDNEYIRDNFELYKQHGDYPSIDHIKSIFIGFKNNIPPFEIADINNLAITKRRINSSKKIGNYKGVKSK